MGCGASLSKNTTPAAGQTDRAAKSTEEMGVKNVSMPDSDDLKEDTISTAATSRSETPPMSQTEPDTLASWPAKMLLDAPDHPFMIYGVYKFLPWSQRADVMCLSRAMHRFFKAENVHGETWQWHCTCLCAESFLVLPSLSQRKLKEGRGPIDYKALLEELWPYRHRFFDSLAEEEGDSKPLVERYAVSVFARMRPAPPAALFGGLCEEMLSTPVTLPLGQRIALLRQRHPELTRGQAMKALLNSKCGAAEALDEGDEDEIEKMLEDTNASSSKRDEGPSFRPQTGSRANVSADAAMSCGSGFTSSVLSVTSGHNGSVLTCSPGIGIRKWDFSEVFAESSSQGDVYDTCGFNFATNLINGQSGSLIVYGQTGSGKTHTMFGAPNSRDGLVTRIADDVLKAVEARRAAGFKVKVGASFIEVFGSDVSNLMGKTGVAKLCPRMGTKYVLEGKFEHGLQESSSFASLLSTAEERKRKASTEMNERSTRAHTLVILRVRQQAPNQNTMVESFLSLVDLGGSERVSKSKANEMVRAPGGVTVGGDEVSRVTWQEYYKSRERVTETNNINKGLLALKRCVQALNERQQRMKEGRPLVRIPYTDSKLTVLLQPALSGQANTSIVVCCSSEDKHADETVQSLRFGEMCSSVEHEKIEKRNDDAMAVVASAVEQIDAQIKEVETQIRAKEKWEWRKAIRQDVVDEMDTGGAQCNKEETMELGGAGAVEILADDGASKKRTVDHEIWSQVLVGAEAENARREELLKTRMRLLGGD